MGSVLWPSHLENAVIKGLVPESVVDTAFKRGYIPQFMAGRFDDPRESEWYKLGIKDINSPEHQKVVHEAALQGLVLLRNHKQLLPLSAGNTKLAVVGPLALEQKGLMCGYRNDHSCFGGDYDCIDTIAGALERVNKMYQNQANRHVVLTTMAAGVPVNKKDESGINAALQLVEECDVAVLVLGLTSVEESEGHDRKDTALPPIQEEFALKVRLLSLSLICCNLHLFLLVVACCFINSSHFSQHYM
jgi:beta-glucosidase